MPRHALAVDRHVLLVEMPAARTHDQRRDLVVQPVRLAVLLERDRAAYRVLQVDLAVDLVRPARRVRILEVRHVRVGAGVQRVDDHLALDGARDLDTAALQVGRQRRDLPVAFADRLRVGQEIGAFAGVEALGAFDAGLQQRLATRLERTVQRRDERECFRRQDCFVTRLDFAGDRHALRQRDRGAHESHLLGRSVAVSVKGEGGSAATVMRPGRGARGLRVCRTEPGWRGRRADRPCRCRCRRAARRVPRRARPCG